MKCEYSEFFKAYTATIPVIDGSQFKFIVEEKLMTSSMHPTHYCLDSKTENNIVTTYHYIFDSDSKTANHKKSPLVSSLSLSNPAFNESILALEKEFDIRKAYDKGSRIHGENNKYNINIKACDDDFFNTECDSVEPTSQKTKISNFAEIEDLKCEDLVDQNRIEASPSGKGLTIRVKSECFHNKEIGFYDKEESESSQETEEYQKNILHSGVYHIGKDCDGNSNDVYEDSSFLHPKGVGIADGVSSWSTYFIRTDIFANALMDNAKIALEKSIENLHMNPQNGDGNEDPIIYSIDPSKIIDEAFSTAIYNRLLFIRSSN